jgi:hypothetical protein
LRGVGELSEQAWAGDVVFWNTGEIGDELGVVKENKEK